MNLSGKQFMQPDLVQQTAQILRQAKLDPRTVKLEITESVIMENTESVTAMLMQLHALNIQLGIDDFGTGYSSLSYLHRFPIDTLKIDRSFVTRMGVERENSAIVRTIVSLAHNLGMNVIAEGVEGNEQLAQLRALGCEYAQGDLFSKPLGAEAATALVLESRLGGRCDL